ncbi:MULTISPECIES: response regulator [Desulfosediminicola]|nr:response regulator [Desulfosediminicola ganghwensis]
MVDDNGANNDVLSTLLGRAGIEVEIETDSARALPLLMQNQEAGIRYER